MGEGGRGEGRGGRRRGGEERERGRGERGGRRGERSGPPVIKRNKTWTGGEEESGMISSFSAAGYLIRRPPHPPSRFF